MTFPLFKKEIKHYDPDVVSRPGSPSESQQQAASDLRRVREANESPVEQRLSNPRSMQFQGRDWPLPHKAALVVTSNPADRLTFHFNPPQIDQSFSTNWQDKNAPGYVMPPQQWTSGGPRVIPLRLFFIDFWNEGENRMNVEESIEWLVTKLYPPEGSTEEAPPLLSFIWGKRPLAPRVTGQTTESYTLVSVNPSREQFDFELYTIRASVDIQLKEFIRTRI